MTNKAGTQRTRLGKGNRFRGRRHAGSVQTSGSQLRVPFGSTWGGVINCPGYNADCSIQSWGDGTQAPAF